MTASSLLQEDALAALVDRAAQAARGAAGVEAFEIRADARIDWKVGVQDARPMGAKTTVAGDVGIRVFVGEQSAYVQAPDLDPASVRDVMARGAALARSQSRRGWRPSAIAREPVAHRRARYAPRSAWVPGHASESDAVALLRRVCEAAKARAPGSEPHASLGARHARTIVTDSLGSSVDLASLVSTAYASVAVRGERLGNGSTRRGGELGLEDLQGGGLAETLGQQAAERALESARAVALPSGRYRVLCDSELAGTLAHESFGHLTEYDLVSSGWSMLRGHEGETLAAPEVSVTDAPVVKDGREGVVVPFDDQGTRGEAVTMLDRGVLRRWLHTRESAAEAGEGASGNGRALNASFVPLVRMRNTYFEPGDRTLEEAFEALGDGLYLCGARGGAPQSDGSFMFTAIRGYRVQGGEVREPIRTAAIHGNVLEFLKDVECLTRDFEVSTNYFGGCGKRDQSFMHVGVGGPHVLVRDALVGGA